MLPDVSEAMTEWLRPYMVKTLTQVTVDYVDKSTVAGRTIQAVIQVANKRKLNADAIDWSLRYLQIHSPDQVQVGEFIEYDGEDYKIIDDGDWQLYGYTEAVAEQTKRTPLVVTP